MADISRITDLSGNTYNIKDAKARTMIPYIVGTQAAATNAWTGVAPFSLLEAGQVIVYHLPYAGTPSSATLNLTLNTDPATTTGAINIYSLNDTAVTDTFPAGSDFFMVYDGTSWKISAAEGGGGGVEVIRL